MSGSELRELLGLVGLAPGIFRRHRDDDLGIPESKAHLALLEARKQIAARLRQRVPGGQVPVR